MKQNKDSQEKKTVFRRIGGRIVPITVAAGAAVTLDAARTKRIYEQKGLTIDKKSMSFLPLNLRFGDQITLRKDGKKIGTSSFYSFKKNGEKLGSFSWLSVENAFQGKGYSKVLTKQSAVEMKKAGIGSVVSTVVHENSMRTNFNKRRDSLFLDNGNGKQRKINFKTALRSIKQNDIKGFGQADKFVIRKTRISSVGLKSAMKPYRTLNNKIRLAAGVSLMAAGLFSYINRAGKK